MLFYSFLWFKFNVNNIKLKYVLVNSKKISYEEIDIGYDTNKREEMMEKANGMRTIPQIFIGNFHVGGNAELQTLEKEGKLNALVGI